MDPSHLDELIELEDSYWWHVAKRKLVTSLLAKHFPPPGILVEGGIGSARNLVEFRELGYEVHGFDIMTESVEHARERGLEHVRQHDLSLPWPLEPQSVRVAVLLDVLEHLADPAQVLRHVANVIEPDGGVIVTVPAYPWLYGNWDKSLGHFRRYTATTLKQHAAEASLQVEWMSHWNAFSLPAAIAVRGYQKCLPRDDKPDFPRVSPLMNRMLLSMASCERSWLGKAKSPFGLSLVGVLRK
jgi:SAM-dependent methyltransferase